MQTDAERRKWLGRGASLAVSGLLAAHSNIARALPPPETTRLRLVHAPFICLAPQYMAEEFYGYEGFTQWDYLPLGTRDGIRALAEGRADIAMWNTPEFLYQASQGMPLVGLAGVHGGCYELFGNDRVQAVRDLRGRTAAVHYLGGGDHVMLSTMLSYVGIDPRREIRWITGRQIVNAMNVFAEGAADAFMGFAQEPVELRARKIGHVIINTGEDRPWSQYFCCMVVANRDFAKRHPIATKRALRAILKAADVCWADPGRAARFLVEKLYETRYPIGLEVMKAARFGHWREADPEDTMRFFALRLRDVGMIESTPDRLIAQATDWRFLNELKREMKI